MRARPSRRKCRTPVDRHRFVPGKVEGTSPTRPNRCADGSRFTGPELGTPVINKEQPVLGNGTDGSMWLCRFLFIPARVARFWGGSARMIAGPGGLFGGPGSGARAEDKFGDGPSRLCSTVWCGEAGPGVGHPDRQYGRGATPDTPPAFHAPQSRDVAGGGCPEPERCRSLRQGNPGDSGSRVVNPTAPINCRTLGLPRVRSVSSRPAGPGCLRAAARQPRRLNLQDPGQTPAGGRHVRGPVPI